MIIGVIIFCASVDVVGASRVLAYPTMKRCSGEVVQCSTSRKTKTGGAGVAASAPMDLETCLDSLYASNDEEEVEDSDDGKGVAALAYNPPAALPACLDPKLFGHHSPIINDTASHYENIASV